MVAAYDTQLTVVINKCLGKRPLTSRVPEELYLVFKQHLEHYPHDTNFLYATDESIFCMEEGCYVEIPLAKNTLTGFQHHVQSHPTHQTQRNKRIQAIQQERANSPVLKPQAKAENPFNKINKPVASGSGLHPLPTGLKKRSSSPTGQHDSAKKHKSGATPGVLADKINAGVGGAQPPADYAAKWAALDRDERVAEATLAGVRATGGNSAEHFNAIDESKKALIDIKRRRAEWKALYGVPAGFAPAVPALSGADQVRAAAARAQLAAARAQLAARGAGAAAVDAMVDLPAPAPVDFGDEYTGSTSSEDFSAFLKAATEGKDFEGNDTVDAAAAKLGLAEHKTPVAGMAIPLMPHQIIGVAWMREQEDSKWYGGILADEMGLGKTVQTIACMAHNESTDPEEKTTLIIAPLALLQQWKNEILDKMAPNHWRVLVHHGKERAKTKKELSRYDVVLTTYHTLAGEWPDEEAAVKKARKGKGKGRAADDDDEDDFITLKDAGPLFKVGWFRIVLDEAQNIRNRTTKISRSVGHLDGLYRWCLTGTPITNSLGDLFPLFRFIQIKPWYTWKDYREHVIIHEKKRPDLAGKRAQVILSCHCLRRKKTSQLDGKDLVSLPSKTVELQVLEFTKEEREIYTFVETRSQATFNKYLKAGTVLKNYASVLVMLLRLRQLCLHPCLISDGFDALAVSVEDENALILELDRAKKIMGAVPVARLRKKLLEQMAERVRAEQKGEEPNDDGDGDCPVCFDPLAEVGDAVVTRCAHAFCKGCITDVLNGPPTDEDANDAQAVKYKDDERACPVCRGPIAETALFQLKAFEPTDEELAENSGDMDIDTDEARSDDDEPDDDEFEDLDAVVARKKDKAKKASGSKSGAPKQNNRAIVIDSDDEDAPEPAPEEMSETKAGKQKAKELPGWMAKQEPSTKLIWLYTEIARLAKEKPEEKVLVISQFTSALDLVEDYLLSMDIKVTRYQGDMNATEREESVRILAKSKKCMVMLMSLKCGGVGLNLVRANNVVNMDLAWSHAVEQQAFDRCHCIGQTRDVVVNRLTIANTVEQRIGDLQDRKRALADHSLGEGTGKRLGKLTVTDLANLFGLDHRGRRQAATPEP